ncbi:TetR/AcrR family transcriptional regulator [Paracoccus angustae]|uniref:TetR/AcrR family transcriptional regulator n=1 Tax=Paracoccus angustae TaxID=1671480 RepID=A0ABV7UAT4_9RHOB
MTQRQDQRDRTRAALLEGARTILMRGEALSVTAAAREAGISKASAYRYFSDPALLAAEAGLHLKAASYEEIVGKAATLRDKLVAISLYCFDLAVANEAAFRTYLGLNLQAVVQSQDGRMPRRGARRIQAFMRALESDKGISPEQARSIAAALGMATGAEAMIALFDVADLSAEKARALVAETAQAICDRMLP